MKLIILILALNIFQPSSMWQINDSRNKDIIVEGVYTIDIVHFDPEW